MKFEKMKLSHLGSTAEDGVNLIDEVEQHLSDLAYLVTNELYGDKARVDISIALARSGEESVTVDAKVKTVRPRRKRIATMAFLNGEGELMTQRGEQLALPIKKRQPSTRAIMEEAQGAQAPGNEE